MDKTKDTEVHNILKKRINSNAFNSWFQHIFQIHLITPKTSNLQTFLSLRCVPLARVGGDVAVPHFPGKGGAIKYRAAGGTAFGRLKSQARASGVLTPHFPCQGLHATIIAHMF
jgi:hypothetical protein